MISIVVIDDEPRARETIINLLKISPVELTLAGEADSVQSAYETINLTSPDLVLLDINLPDGSGFDLLKMFEQISFRVIFVTAHNEYAIRAFKYSAVDYIMKPITAGELFRALEKTKAIIDKEETAVKLSTLLQNLEKLKKIVLKTAERVRPVAGSRRIFPHPPVAPGQPRPHAALRKNRRRLPGDGRQFHRPRFHPQKGRTVPAV